jgi:hypothetical protein
MARKANDQDTVGALGQFFFYLEQEVFAAASFSRGVSDRGDSLHGAIAGQRHRRTRDRRDETSTERIAIGRVRPGDNLAVDHGIYTF